MSSWLFHSALLLPLRKLIADLLHLHFVREIWTLRNPGLVHISWPRCIIPDRVSSEKKVDLLGAIRTHTHSVSDSSLPRKSEEDIRAYVSPLPLLPVSLAQVPIPAPSPQPPSNAHTLSVCVSHLDVDFPSSRTLSLREGPLSVPRPPLALTGPQRGTIKGTSGTLPPNNLGHLERGRFPS